MNSSRSAEISTFTLIKGSLIPETYAAFRGWDFQLDNDLNFARLRQNNSIGSASSHWLRDVAKVLHRRFDPMGRDRALVVLAQRACPLEVWKPILLWHMTRDEFLLRDFTCRWLSGEFRSGRYAIRKSDVIEYLKALPAAHASTVENWSVSTKDRLAGSLLHSLADFGLVEGKVVRHFASYHLPDDSFMYLLHAIRDMQPNARQIIDSEDWQLFLMSPSDVEQTLFRLHQFQRVHFEVAGSLAQLRLPCNSALEFAERMC